MIGVSTKIKIPAYFISYKILLLESETAVFEYVLICQEEPWESLGLLYKVINPIKMFNP
jgi:hypothetical protein